MEIFFAILSDAATVREGLLHVLGGAITRIFRPLLPAPLGVTLALVIRMDQEVAALGLPHELSVTIRNDEGVVNQGMAGFQPTELPPRLEPGEKLLIPIVIPQLQAVATTRYGRHSLEVSLDNGQPTTMEFWVLHPDEMVIPPI